MQSDALWLWEGYTVWSSGPWKKRWDKQVVISLHFAPPLISLKEGSRQYKRVDCNSQQTNIPRLFSGAEANPISPHVPELLLLGGVLTSPVWLATFNSPPEFTALSHTARSRTLQAHWFDLSSLLSCHRGSQGTRGPAMEKYGEVQLVLLAVSGFSKATVEWGTRSREYAMRRLWGCKECKKGI